MRLRRPLAIAALTTALVGCGGGSARPDGGDARLDVGSDTTEGGGEANGIVVDLPSGLLASESLDGRCDILEAVAAAAGRKTVDECANPKGFTRIILQAGATYPVRKTLRLTPGTEIGLADGATGSATIAATAGFAVDTRDASSACLVSLADGPQPAWLRDVILTQDPGLTLTGACLTQGELGLRRAHVTGFRASGLVATCLPESGCDHTATSQSSTLRVLNSIVDGNHNGGKGGGIASEGAGATVFVAHSAIVNNISDDDGGGIYLGGGWNTDFIRSSTISGNISNGDGGGVMVRFVEATTTYVHIFNSTIANNTAGGSGGGISFDPPSLDVGTAHDISVFSSIVAGNFSPSISLEWNINAWNRATGVFNCVNGSFIYVAPGLPRPTDMGGCTFDVRNPFLGRLTPMGGAGDLPLHPLLAGSPAVDAALDDDAPDEQRDAWINDIDPQRPADWMLFDPLVDGDGTAVRDLGAYERDDRWQTELMDVLGVGPSTHAVVTIPGGYDRGAGTMYTATSATGEFVTYALPIGEPGRYDLTVRGRSDANAGKFQIAIASDPTGPWIDVGGEQDGFSAAGGFVSMGPFTTPLFTSPGERLLRFTVTGKNPASTGFQMALDYVEAKKRTDRCPVAALAAGGTHTCALLLNTGGVRCWGMNGSGQIGGGGPDQPSPPAADVMTGAAAVATGGSHTCVLSSDGGVRCWGGNASGQLGDGTTTSRGTPPAAPVLSGVKAIAAGRAYTCALMNSGGVRCWGANESGQLGDGTTVDRSLPPIADVLSDVKAITAGGTHTCALTNAGGVRCWGANTHGQLGDGTTDDRAAPSASDVIGDIAAVSAGDTHTCALTNAGGVRCWGHNGDAELGTGNNDIVLSPPTTDVLSGVKQVVASNVFTCALLTTGGVRCWGFNSHGEIGDDTMLQVDRPSPATVDVLGGAASLAAGATHVCARMTSGGVRCWGGNEWGQLGDGMAPVLALTPPERDLPGFAGTCE